MGASFVAIDVETANPSLASICQIGVVTFEQGKPVERWSSYVDPEDYFDGMNIVVHGIDEDTVRGAPKLPDIYDDLRARLAGRIVVSHTSFDRTSISQAFSRYALTSPDCRWLDSARVVRRAWSEFARSGYGLASVCKHLGIEFKHHDAAEDAWAAGQVLQKAIEATGLSIDDWLTRVYAPINLQDHEPIRRDGALEGPLKGNELVFTGALSITRNEAADLAAAAGCAVASGVRKTTTILVVGDQDVDKLNGHAKSSKHRKAEELMANGQPIRILRESDFQRLIALDAERT